MDFMKVYPIAEKFQAYRLPVGNEMHFVAPSGQSYSQFRGYNTTTPKSRVTYYSDFHFSNVTKTKLSIGMMVGN